AAGRRIDLFGKQAHIVGEAAQALEGVLGFAGGSTAEGEIFRAPEPADAEGALAARILGTVAVKETAPRAELLADTRVGLAHPLRRRFLESVPGQQEQARVEAIAIEPGDVAAQAGVPGS